MKFRQLDRVVYSQDPYYDLIDHGRINAHDLLESTADAERVYMAVEIIRDFIEGAIEVGVLEET